MDLICFDFINSNWYKLKDNIEPFGNEEWVNRFLNKWEMGHILLPTDELLAVIVRLRYLLTDIVEKIQLSGDIEEKDINSFNDFMALTSVYRKIDNNEGKYRINYIPASYDWNWIISYIANSFGELICNYDITNIKICENTECKFVFYDSSKNHSKRWCCDTCRNLIKVRRFRAKQSI